MKKSISNYRSGTSSGQAEKAFYNRMEQDYFLIRKVAKSKSNTGGIEAIIAARIERIQYSIKICKCVQPKLKTLLDKYQTLLQPIQI